MSGWAQSFDLLCMVLIARQVPRYHCPFPLCPLFADCHRLHLANFLLHQMSVMEEEEEGEEEGGPFHHQLASPSALLH